MYDEMLLSSAEAQSIQRFNFSLNMRTPCLASALKRGIFPLENSILDIKNGPGRGGGEIASS